HLGLALKYSGGASPHDEAPKAVGVGLQLPVGQQLPDDGAPAVHVELGADAVGAELIVAELAHALVIFAEQHINQVARPKTLPGAHDGGEQFLGFDGAVEGAYGL